MQKEMFLWERKSRGKSVGNRKIRSVKKPRNSSVYAEFENSVSRRSKTWKGFRGTFEEVFWLIVDKIKYDSIQLETPVNKPFLRLGHETRLAIRR